MNTTPGDPDRSGDRGEGPSPEQPTQPLGSWGQPAPPPPTSGYGYPPAGPGSGLPPGYPPPYPGYRVPDHPRATTVLVLGIVAVVGGMTCYLPLLLGPFAWAMGRSAVREIDADPQRLGGRGQAMAGYVLGVVATVLMVLGLLVLVAFLVFAFGTSAMLEGRTLGA
jgi:hypothetical protein